MGISVITDAQRSLRELELAAIEEREAKAREEARKNRGFTQVYSKGWRRIRELSRGNAGATGLYAFLAEHIDRNCGAVVCDQKFLAESLGVSTRTIRSWIRYLEDENAIVKIPVAGRVCAYALDPYEVWKGYDNAKEYAAFMTKTLVNKDGDIKRRIMSMFSGDKDEGESYAEDAKECL